MLYQFIYFGLIIVFVGVACWSFKRGEMISYDKKDLKSQWRQFSASMGVLCVALIISYDIVVEEFDPEKYAQIKAEQKVEKAEEARKEREAANADTPDNMWGWIYEGKENVKLRLKDPYSAKFQNVIFSRGPTNSLVVCGEVNAKNSWGAYEGYKRFITTLHPSVSFMESDMRESDFLQAWSEQCSNVKYRE